MRVAVVAHHTRSSMAEHLAEQVHADRVFTDDKWRGALWNHRRAIGWAAGQDQPVIIVEDDAQPVPMFREYARQWHARFRNYLVSLYLGTGRPPQWQPEIDRKLAATNQDWISLPQLIHGVAYMASPDMYKRVLEELRPDGAADYAIGDAYRKATGLPVIYPVRSLVDHAETPSVERHPDGMPRKEARHARTLEIT